MNKLLQFLQDGDGAFSSYRLMFVAWGGILLGLVTYLTIANRTLPNIDTSLVMLYGTVVSGKVIQSFSENISPPNK